MEQKEQTTETAEVTEKATIEKKQKKYMAVLMTDYGDGNIKEQVVSEKLLQAMAGAVTALLIVTFVSLIYGMTASRAVRNENAGLQVKLGELTMEKSQLQSENEKLAEKVLLLSETVNQKVQAEAEAVEKAIPSGFPLAGITTIIEEEAEADTEDADAEVRELPEPKEEMMIFEAAKGNSVIASGSGIISSIEDDEKWGKILKIDHGNGYISVYRIDEEPKVKVEDEVTKATRLFEITDDSKKIGYQIIKDGAYVDPMDLMEISG